jgi:hypothetical protein
MPYRFFHNLAEISNKVSEVNRISRENNGPDQLSFIRPFRGRAFPQAL